jgi:hypothetical protein
MNKGVGQLNSGKKVQEGQSKLKTKQKINRKTKNKQTKPKTKEKRSGSSGKEEFTSVLLNVSKLGFTINLHRFFIHTFQKFVKMP